MIVGVLGLAGFRYMTVPPPNVTHHHANGAVFVNGERVELTADRFMEGCGRVPHVAGRDPSPDRIHLHDGGHDVVHVHHPASTWGHLLANLGPAAGPDYLFTPDGERHFRPG